MSIHVEPNQMFLAILIDLSQQGKATSISRNKVHFFVSKLCLHQAQQYLVPLELQEGGKVGICTIYNSPEVLLKLAPCGFCFVHLF